MDDWRRVCEVEEAEGEGRRRSIILQKQIYFDEVVVEVEVLVVLEVLVLGGIEGEGAERGAGHRHARTADNHTPFSALG